MEEDFMNVIVPIILKNQTDYYIMGGRSFDFYFKNSTNSIDWDIVITRQSLENLTRDITEYGKKLNWTLNVVEQEHVQMVQFKFLKSDGNPYYYDDSKDPYFMDLHIKEDFNCEIPLLLNDLRYMDLTCFIKDLAQTLIERRDKLKKYIKTFTKKTDEKIRNIKDVRDLKRFMFEQVDLEEEDLNNISTILLSKIKTTINEYKDYEEGTNLGTISARILEQINKTVSEYEEDESEENEINEILKEKYTELNEEIGPSITEYFLNLQETNMMSKKYNKTVRRCENVINISWDNLSDNYKMHLISKCNKNEIELFNVSPLCQAYLKCEELHIAKKTEKCFHMEEEKKEN